MKKTLFLIAFITWGIAVQAQDTAIVKQQAQIMLTAFLKGDLNTLVNYTYPKVVSMMGGKAKMMSMIKTGTEKMKEVGTSFRSGTIGKVSKIYPSGKELHCTVDQNLIMGVKGGYLTTDSQLLGISGDNGKTWTFITLSNLNSTQLKQLFPEFNKALVVKKAAPPVFHEE
ncbi:hypothetical protein [Pedobacter sp. GR22-6]|uniref:hypothetical protein n=1 Tax=Pedobacter sp. GR22-6 TaxID=3127957 RepID=UPI00307CFFCD